MNRPLIACHTHCYGPFGAVAAIENVGAAGLESVQLVIHTSGLTSRWGERPLVSTDSTLRDLDRVSSLLDANGVRVASCTCAAGSHLDPAQVALMKRKLDLASHFAVPVVVGEAGVAESDAERTTICANLQALGDYAERLHLTVCLDTQRGLCVDHREMLRLMRALDHPRLRLNFDTGNILCYNEHASVEVALAKVCQFVSHVHLKDSSGVYGDRSFPELGSGAVDFLRTWQILRDCGFPGPYSILIEESAAEPEPSLEKLQRRVVASVTYLRALGYFD
ncbi:MAG: sugar phosphate isomerase/epimerase family protein [Planctomycetaceae bacterium]